MSVQNLKNEIERLKNLIDKAEKVMPILDESITNLEKYKVKKIFFIGLAASFFAVRFFFVALNLYFCSIFVL